MHNVLVSYVYTLTEEKKESFEKDSSDSNLSMPMLFSIGVRGESGNSKYNFHALPCFFQHRDFLGYKDSGFLVGSVPENFKHIPYRRFGCTGLFKRNKEVYCGSWNGVYVVDYKTYGFKRFVTNKCTQDIHGLFVRENGQIVTMLASQDAMVVTNPDGSVAGAFSINPDLSINAMKEDTDWRLVNKDRRGVCGFWHFNYVQEFGDELWITSRCINGFVIVNTKTLKVSLKTLRLGEEALVHDGIKVGNTFYFTSIGGKIIVATEYDGDGNSGMNTNVYQLMVMDGEQKRVPTWGRGIGVKDDWWYTTLDGRYGAMHGGFRLVRVKRVEGKDSYDANRIRYQNVAVIGEGEDFDSITGFDVLVQ